MKYTITVNATNEGGKISGTFEMNVAAAAPTANGAIPPISWTLGSPFAPVDLAKFFSGEAITFTADGLPAGFTLSPAGVLALG